MPHACRSQDAPTVTYCTNIHPARGLAAVKESIERVSLPLKARLAPDQIFPLGIRLSDEESRELGSETARRSFAEWLRERGLRVACVNGFPFGPFHHEQVKDDVHRPDWSDERRVEYTVRLGETLALLKPESHGGVSTSPLSYGPWGPRPPRERATMTENIARVAAAYAKLSRTHDVDLHLDIEPEPDGLLGTSREFSEWFTSELLPAAIRAIRRSLGVGDSDAEIEARRRVAVCLDTCHAAVEYEEAAEVIERYAAAGVRIGRVQVSSALRVLVPEDGADRANLGAALAPFAESTYLHQTVGRGANGEIERWRDLPEALHALASTRSAEWRVHYHVPIFYSGHAPLLTTQSQTIELVRMIRDRALCDLFEAETYTWDVLPPALRLDLVDSLDRELRWLADLLSMSKHPAADAPDCPASR